tara:strand:- start:357 stop:1529 length:1173 start_codon:yes stop_codon:yes gene_type:complete
MSLTKISTDGVKDDAITKAKIPADQIEASELANNAVDTNAIQDEAVTLAKLEHGDANNNGKFLRANNGADPSFEDVPAGGISNVVEDTTPQLGGSLDMNNKNITSNDSTGGGNNRIVLGSGSDLNLYSDGTNVRYEGNNLHFKNANGDEYLAKMIDGGAVELYHNNEKKLFTTANGVDVQAEGSAVELRLKTDGGTLRGYVYGNNSNEFGFLSAAGYWPIKHTNSSKTEFFIGSNKVFAVDADGSVTKPLNPCAAVYTTPGAYGASNNKIHNVVLGNDTERWDIGNDHSYTNSKGQFTCPVDGIYSVSFSTNIEVSNAGGAHRVILQKNDVTQNQFYNTTDVGSWQFMSFNCLVQCSANDYLHLVLYSNGGSIGVDSALGWNQTSYQLVQ